MSAVVVDIKTGRPVAPKVQAPKQFNPRAIVWWLKPVYWTLILALGFVVLASDGCRQVSKLWRNDL